MFSLVIKPDELAMPAGSVVNVPASWQDYQTMAERLGDRPQPRLKYRQGELILWSRCQSTGSNWM